MLNFPDVKEPEPMPKKRLSLREYIQFCDFCAKNNPHVTAENWLTRGKDKLANTEAFHF